MVTANALSFYFSYLFIGKIIPGGDPSESLGKYDKISWKWGIFFMFVKAGEVNPVLESNSLGSV